MPGNVFWKDINGKYLGCNRNLAQILKLNSCDEIIGKANSDLYDIKLAKLTDAMDAKVIAKGEELTLEEIGLDVLGRRTIYLTKKIPLYDGRGTVIGLLGISFDIGERKKIEAELKKSKKQAEESSKLKSQFISDMEHDLRTPCSGIAAMTEILEKSETNQERKENLHHVAKASARLLDILNGILSFDQTVSGILPIIDKKFSIKKIIDGIFAIETPSVISKKLKLAVNYDDNIPKSIIGDEHRIARILLNIISNAIKFTPKGYVTVSIKMPKIVDEQHAVLQVIVEDTGIGIPSDKLEHIYERFVRVIPANENKYTGTGLGLSVVKRFIEDINGEIDAESVLGEGSKFTCTFPVKVPLVDDEPVENKPKGEKLTISSKQKFKILLVEDDALAQTVASSFLKETLANNLAGLDIASLGKEAVKLTNKNKYDLIFMDVGLPDIKGYEVTRKIRNLKTSKNKGTTIVALTAHDTAQEKKKSHAAGMDDFLTKPLNTEKIAKAIQKFLCKKAPNKKLKTKKPSKIGKAEK